MVRSRRRALVVLAASLLVAAGLSACGDAKSDDSASPGQATTATRQLPGTGKPAVTIGDKNFTEQFLLGELYNQALTAQGYTIMLNRDIGPTEVTIQALYSGRLAMYPEYLDVWDSAVAGIKRSFHTRRGAYLAGRQYARAHGLELLDMTPFSDTDALAVTTAYSVQQAVRTIGDLSKASTELTLGAPPQFQRSPTGLPAVERTYGFMPGAFKPLAIGEQYAALDHGSVQAADVNTTDGELVGHDYTLLRDPRRVFGFGQVVPVVSARVLHLEGPAFAATINRVSALLTIPVIRHLNAAVDVYHQDPALVAKRFLLAHGLLGSR
jgi:osmoprotectant transport system substrate-binding protein